MNWREQTIAGVKNSIPVVLGYTPLGLAFGVIAHGRGLSVWQTGLMSFTALSGSGQFIAMAMLANNAGLSAILLTTFLVNSRYLLFSASLAPHVKKMPSWLQMILAFGITDENYAVNISRLDTHEPSAHFMLGVNFPSHLSWTVNSMIGAYLGGFFTNADKVGLNFALPAMFIALLSILVKNRLMLVVAAAAGLLSTIIYATTGSSANVLISTVIAAAAGTVIVRWKQKSAP